MGNPTVGLVYYTATLHYNCSFKSSLPSEMYKVKRVKLKLSFCLLIAQEVKDKFFRKKLIFNFPQLSK